jgi:hypothetical protein
MHEVGRPERILVDAGKAYDILIAAKDVSLGDAEATAHVAGFPAVVNLAHDSDDLLVGELALAGMVRLLSEDRTQPVD